MSEADERSAPSGLIRSSGIIAVGTGLSRLTGMLRVVALAAVLGGGPLADAYNLANVSPNVLYELLLGGVLSATLIPLFVQAYREGDDDGPSAVFSVATVVLLLITVVAVLAAPLVARLYGTQLSGSAAAAQRDLVVPFLHLILPEIFFYGVVALTTAALNARRRFVAAAFAPVLNNLVLIVILGLVAFRYDDVAAISRDSNARLVLGLGTTAGIAAMAWAQVVATRRAGIRLKWMPQFGHPAVRQVARLSGWTLGYVVANQVALLFVLSLANGHGAGTVTAYQNAFVYFQLPHGLVAVSVMTAFLPELADAFSSDDPSRFSSTFRSGGRLMATFVIPSAFALIVLAQPIVTLFLAHGEYRPAAARLAGSTLSAFAWGLPGFSLYLYALRGFYARKDTKTPFLLNLGENGLNVVFAIALAFQGAPGLARAYAIAYTVAGVAAVVVLERTTDSDQPGRPDAEALLRVGAASLPMVVVLLLVRAMLDSSSSTGALLLLIVAGALGGASYLAAAWYVDVDGVRRIVGRVAHRFTGGTLQ